MIIVLMKFSFMKFLLVLSIIIDHLIKSAGCKLTNLEMINMQCRFHYQTVQMIIILMKFLLIKRIFIIFNEFPLWVCVSVCTCIVYYAYIS